MLFRSTCLSSYYIILSNMISLKIFIFVIKMYLEFILHISSKKTPVVNTYIFIQQIFYFIFILYCKFPVIFWTFYLTIFKPFRFLNRYSFNWTVIFCSIFYKIGKRL